MVVEGYTDVMACHLAGVETAVATCGTAFGADHIKTLRRIMRDEAGLAPAKVIFTFDGDAAGQKAAMRAFADDQKWTSQSFVAVEKSGKDPCELRQARGDPAVQALIEDAVPMFEFAVRTTIKRFDVATAEGRMQAVRAVAPDRRLDPRPVAAAGVHPRGLRHARARRRAGRRPRCRRAGKIKVDEDAREDRRRDRGRRATARDDGEPTAAETAGVMPMPDRRDPVVLAERQLLQVLLQFPTVLQARRHRPARRPTRSRRPPTVRSSTASASPTTAATRPTPGRGRRPSPRPRPRRSPGSSASSPSTRCRPGWTASTGLPTARYVDELFDRVRTIALTRQIADAMSEMRRLDHAESRRPSARASSASQLQTLQRELAAIKAGMG